MRGGGFGPSFRRPVSLPLSRKTGRELTTGVILQTDPLPPLDSWNKKGTLFLICSHIVGSRTMLRMFVEEAAALASIALFVGMIAVWAQVIPQL
jgi:hypothetical protein